VVDDSGLSKLDQAQHRAANFGRGLDIASVGATVALGALAYAGGQAVDALARIETINAQTEAVISSTGGAAGVTAKHVEDLAGSLEELTATEAESVQEAANLLLTFTNVRNTVGAGNDVFDQATAVMVDMARAMGTDVASQAVRVGKALNDPVAGIGALSKVGVQFTDEQESMIRSLVETGDVMGAQKVILGELQTQFGGSGAAYLDTFAGQQEMLAHNLGTVAENIMVAVMPALEDFLGAMVDFSKWASENSDLVGFMAGALGTLSVAILVLNGVWKTYTAVQGLATAAQWASNAAWLASPVTWIIAGIILGIGLLVAAVWWLTENWDGVLGFFEWLWKALGEGFAELIQWIVDGFLNFTPLGLIIKHWEPITQFFGEFWDGLVQGAATAVEWIGTHVGNIISFFTSIPDRVGEAWNGLVGLIRDVMVNVTNFVVDAWNNTLGGLSFDLPWFLGGASISFPRLRNVEIPALAAGGIVTAPTLALIGEAGPEAVVPLSRASEYGVGGRGEMVADITLEMDGRALWRGLKRVQLREG